MKKIFLIILLITVSIKENKAQTYRQLFDNLDQTAWFKAGYLSFQSNIASQVMFEATNAMQAYINMYKATKDVKYLHEFVIHTKRVMDRRDDHISSASPVPDLPVNPGQCGVSTLPVGFMSGTGYPAWSRKELVSYGPSSCGLVPFPHFMETGLICYPMAQFVLLTMEDPSLTSVNLPTEAAFTNVSTFGDFATWLKANIYTSLDWQIATDYNRAGQSGQGCNGTCDAFVSQFSNGWHDINQQCSIGLSLVLMRHIAVLDNDVTHQNNYLWKIQNMAAEFKSLIQFTPSNPATVGNNLPWYSWCDATNCGGNLWEDIAHARIDDEFAEACYNYYPWPGTVYFGLSDMQKFANGLAYRMFPQPLEFTMNVYGNNSNCDQMCPPNATGANNLRYHISGAYSFLSKYNPQIYQEISDFYVPDNVNFFNQKDLGITLLSYSRLALYEHLFNPIAALGGQDRSGAPNIYGGSWLASASGDFNNDGSDEFAGVIINGGVGAIFVYSLSPSDAINLLAGDFPPTAYTGIAGGNFDATSAGDEIAVLNASNVISLLTLSSGNINSFGSTITPAETIISLSSGDFNNDGVDELVALSSSHVFIYQVSLGSLSLLTSFSASGYSKVAIGKYDGGATNEIAVLNSSGSIAIFNSSGTSLYTALGPAGTYAGMAAGDYDGDAISELMVYQSQGTDAAFMVFKVRSGVLSYIPNVGDEEAFPANQLQGVMCPCRFSSYADKDALVTFRNFDSQMNVFTMDGHCPNLYLNNQDIDINYTLNNSTPTYTTYNDYPIDYHTNNIIVASNYTVEAGRTVDFAAGNKIALNTGFSAKAGCKFDAYISPALSCSANNTQYFRTMNTSQAPQANAEPVQGKKNTTDNNIPIGVFPNPTTGEVNVNMYNAQACNVAFSFEEITGRILFSENHALSQGYSDTPLSLSNVANGIYMLRISNSEGSLIKTVKIILQK